MVVGKVVVAEVPVDVTAGTLVVDIEVAELLADFAEAARGKTGWYDQTGLNSLHWCTIILMYGVQTHKL